MTEIPLWPARHLPHKGGEDMRHPVTSIVGLRFGRVIFRGETAGVIQMWPRTFWEWVLVIFVLGTAAVFILVPAYAMIFITNRGY